MTILNNDNFAEEVLNYKGKVLVDFYATWCGPCKMLAPVIEEIDSEIGETVKVCKLDVDDASDIAIKYGVMSIPTVAVFSDGELVDTSVGFVPKDDILRML